MELKNMGFALFVRDIERSKDFYSNVLKLPVELDFGKNVIYKGGITIWEINEKHIIPEMLGADKLTNPECNRFEVYFETDDLPGIYSALKSKETTFLHEIHEEPWGQLTIRFFDPDKHLIEVGESMRQFVGRFFDRGMTIDEISKRTSVPADEVKRLLGL